MSPAATAPAAGYPQGSVTDAPTAGYPRGPAIEAPAVGYPQGSGIGGPSAGYQSPGTPPIWPTGPGPQGGTPGGSIRFSRIIVGVIAVVALALGSALTGGYVVHQLDDGGKTVNRTVVAAPEVDRSSLAGIVQKVRPSVVSIATGSATGSGVIVTADGYILTNNHVAATANGKTVNVTFDSGRTAQATIVGTDPKTDLAVLKSSGVAGLAAAKFGDSSILRQGDTVLALGSPLGLNGTVTVGIVSALNRTIEGDQQQQDPFQSDQAQSGHAAIAGAIQTDAAINPGNSGGALVNLAGEVVGINTAIATSGAGQGNIGVGFAIPSNRAKQVADQLIKGEKVSHPMMGATIGTAQNNGGAVVVSVTSNGPADKAGLRNGDIVTKADGTTIHTQEDLLNVVQSGNVGDKLRLTVMRDKTETEVTVTLGEA